MKTTFDDILRELIDEYARQSEIDLDQFLKNKMVEAGISEGSKDFAENVFNLLHDFNENAKSMEQAEENGINSKQWLKSQIHKTVKEKHIEAEDAEVIEEILNKCAEKALLEGEMS